MVFSTYTGMGLRKPKGGVPPTMCPNGGRQSPATQRGGLHAQDPGEIPGRHLAVAVHQHQQCHGSLARYNSRVDNPDAAHRQGHVEV